MVAAAEVPWTEILHLLQSWLVLGATAGLAVGLLWWSRRHHSPEMNDADSQPCPWRLTDLALIFVLFVLGEYSLQLGVQALRGDAGPGTGLIAPEHLPWFAGDLFAGQAMLAAQPIGPGQAVLQPAVSLAGERSLHLLRYRAETALWATLFSRLLLTVAMVWVLQWRAGARPGQLGLTWRGATASLTLGYLAWLIVTPIVFAIFIVLRLLPDWFGKSEPHLVEFLLTLHAGWGPWLLAMVVAGLSAPLFEEVLLRGILQPLLVERPQYADAMVVTSLVLATLMGLGFGVDSATASGMRWGPLAFLATVGPGYVLFEALTQRWLPRPGSARAIYATSLLFAVLHAGVWPTPVPLFFLSLVLGFVAYRTQSLVGPIVMHSLFNLVSLLPLMPG
jgi:membrane protease YdiL (CAAX protease family)